MEPLHWIEPSFNCTDFARCIKLNEFLDVEVAAADPHINLTSRFNLYVDPSGPKRVYALRLPQKQYLHFITVWIMVDEIGKCPINRVILARNVEAMTLLELCILLYELLKLLLV